MRRRVVAFPRRPGDEPFTPGSMRSWPPPPRLAATYFRAHGLGNDYLVFEEGDRWLATPASVRRVCDRHTGVGSDGIVVLLSEREGGVRFSRMFNPDGSEFERSGNGLRILGAHLARAEPAGSPFEVSVGGDRVRLVVHGRQGPEYDISVDMGQARTGAEVIGLRPGVLDADGLLAGPGGERLRVVPVSVGNPHLVVFPDRSDEDLLAELGPFLSTHPGLAAGANVQLVTPLGEGAVEALIWERGVGRTSASGTSACAVAVATVACGIEPPGPIRVVMPGGVLSVTVSELLLLVLRGPVEEVCTGALTDAAIDALEGRRAG